MILECVIIQNDAIKVSLISTQVHDPEIMNLFPIYQSCIVSRACQHIIYYPVGYLGNNLKLEK